MPPNLSRLNTFSRQPSIDDYDSKRHAVPLNSILNCHSHEDDDVVLLPLQDVHPNITVDECDSQDSSIIWLAHADSGKVIEVAFTTGSCLECPGNSSVRNISELYNSQIEANSSLSNNSAIGASTHDKDPLLCEAVLRSIFAQSSLGRSVIERLRHAQTIKLAFSLQDSIYREAEANAIKAAQYRRAEVQAQLEALKQDKGWSLYPAQFDDFTLYQSCKVDEINELSGLEAYLGKLPPFSGLVQVCIFSAEHLSTGSGYCMKPISCHRSPNELQVYCSVTIISSKSGMTTNRDLGQQEVESCPNHITDEVAYAGTAEWHDESPWIPVKSIHDQILIEVWSKKAPSKIYKGSKEGNSGLCRRKRSSRRKKVLSWRGDPFLGEVVVAVDQIETQALSCGGIQGKTPLISYPLMNARGHKDMSTIRVQFACSCEHLYSDAESDKLLLKPPLNDLERAYDVLLQMAFSTQQEGEFQLESNWQMILGCFESHYRLRKERCCLGIVMHLAQNFQQDAYYLACIVEEWLPACKAAKEAKLTKSELALHSNIVSLLVKPSVDAIENFQSVFPANKPKGALSKLIELLALALCWDPNPSEIVIPLKSWIKVSCERRFQNYFLNSVEGQRKEITAKSLTAAVNLLRKDLANLSSCFIDVFPQEIALIPMSASMYYRLVSGYITGLINATSSNIFTTDYAELAAELFLLHQDLGSLGVKLDLLDLHSIFKNHILRLVATMKPRMIDWISSSISNENWEPISPQTGAFFSFSVVDLYFMINGVVEEMTTRLSCFPFGKHYFPSMENSICTAVGKYIQVIEKLCLQELPDESNEEHGFLTHFKSFHITQSMCISKTLCIKLNNLHAILKQQTSLEASLTVKWQNHVEHPSRCLGISYQSGDFQRNLEVAAHGDVLLGESVGHHFEKLYCSIEQSISNVVGSIVESMQGQLTKGLQKVMERYSTNGNDANEFEDLLPLTTYLDEHLKVMNEWLGPEVLRRLLMEIAESLIFSMEEFALNRDEDPNPMTTKQRNGLEETLHFFYDYFYGDGVGISKSQMDHASDRLRKILVCSDLSTRDLCSLYWKAWDKFTKDSCEPSGSVNSHDFLGDHKDDDEDAANDVHLHLVDFLLLLQQRDDDEAQVIVANQNLIAKTKMMQFIFALPKEEEMVASYTCRNSRKLLGTLYITAKRVCFADASMVVPDNRRLFVMPFERIMRISAIGNNSILFVPFNHQPEHFSRFSDCEAVCKTIYYQVIGTGMILEKYMAPFWGEATGNNFEHEITSLQRFRCCRQGLISKHQGWLIVAAAYLIFEPDDKKKRIHFEHGAVSQIHAERRGLRASGVVIELKTGKSLEFVDFMDMNLPAKEIAKELQKAILGGSIKVGL